MLGSHLATLTQMHAKKQMILTSQRRADTCLVENFCTKKNFDQLKFLKKYTKGGGGGG